VGEAVQEAGAYVQLDQQRGDRRERQHPGQLILELPGLGGNVLGGQLGDHQLVIAIQPDRSGIVRQSAGQGLLQIRQRGAQLLLALLQGVSGLGRLADQRAERGLSGRPLLERVQVGRRVRVPPRPRHEDVPGPEPPKTTHNSQ
jgi:hypothetical protein